MKNLKLELLATLKIFFYMLIIILSILGFGGFLYLIGNLIMINQWYGLILIPILFIIVFLAVRYGFGYEDI